MNRFQAAIVSRLKIMARMNIAEKRVPQDGRIKLRVKGREIDLRVSIIPMMHGEGVVMRVLDKENLQFSLRGIGMSPEVYDQFQKLIRLPHGIVLVTGPTGSGKTTTLYSALNEIKDEETKIITTEDPIEYQLEGINQIQVHTKVGLTFAASLRSILRHDPDVVLVGEIRDLETAENAVQASLTGHLVFSTLHTNDSAGAFMRLCDMGVEPFSGDQHGRGRDGPAAGAVVCVRMPRGLRTAAQGAAGRLPAGRTGASEDRRSTDRAAAASVATPAIAVGWASTNCCGPTTRFVLWPTSVNPSNVVKKAAVEGRHEDVADGRLGQGPGGHHVRG